MTAARSWLSLTGDRARRGAELFEVRAQWRALRFFSLYRIVLSGLLVVLVVARTLPPPLGQFDQQLFGLTALTYLACAVLALVAIERRLGSYRRQVYLHIALDVAAITMLMHASGGVDSGVGILLVIAVAGSSLLSSGRIAVLAAAAATLAILAQALVSYTYAGLMTADFTQAGLLGAVLFATAMVGYALAERLRASEALAARQAIDIASLSQLSERIVQRMRSGVLVLDYDGRIALSNSAARMMLAAGGAIEGRGIESISPDLAAHYRDWLTLSHDPLHATITSNAIELNVSYTGITPRRAEDGSGTAGHRGEWAGALVYLEDAAETRQRAQQLKLASLGRLTASIAHEIRNPLGAISHAGQLLSESERLSADDLRLTDIIAQHSRRMNAIIENILALGRRETAISESFELAPWLHEFAAEIRERKGLGDGDLVTEIPDQSVRVRFDRNQLLQILWNLVENALRYGRQRPFVTLRCAIVPETGRSYLEVIDTGPGMTEEVAEQVFEPFFTKERGGTGLGLYIARELAEANQATVTLVAHGPAGCRFRVSFAHPDRRQVKS